MIASADLNGDGRPDIVSGNMTGAASVLLNAGANFTSQPYTIDRTADAGADLAVSVDDALIDESEKTTVAFEVRGLDADATAVVTFTSAGGGTPVTRTVYGNGSSYG